MFKLRQICVAMILLFTWQMSGFAQPLDYQPPLVNQLKSSPSPYAYLQLMTPVSLLSLYRPLPHA